MRVEYRAEVRSAMEMAIRDAIESMKSSTQSYSMIDVLTFIEDTYAAEVPTFQVQADQFPFLICTPSKVLILRIPTACKARLPVFNLPEMDKFSDEFFSEGGNTATIVAAAFLSKSYKLGTRAAQKFAARKGNAFPLDFPCEPLRGVGKETRISFSKKEEDVKASTFIRPMLAIWLDEEGTQNPSKEDFIFAGSVGKAVELIAEKAVMINEFYGSLIVSNKYIVEGGKAVSKDLTALKEVMSFLQGEKFKAPALYASAKGFVSWYQAFSIGAESYTNAFMPLWNDVEALRKNKKVKLEKPERIEVFSKMCQAFKLDAQLTDKETLLFHTIYNVLREIVEKPKTSIFQDVIDYAMPLTKIVDGHAKRLAQLLSFSFIRSVASGKGKKGNRYVVEKFFYVPNTISTAATILARIALYGGVFNEVTGKWSGETTSVESTDSGV